MKTYTAIVVFLFSMSLFAQKQMSYLQVSDDGSALETVGGNSFFWLGDTGWLLPQKLNHQDVEKYLDDRKQKGFNVVQMMVLHDAMDVNFYNDKALVDGNLVAPYVTNGKAFSDYIQYDYWDNVEWVVDACAKRGIYAALVPIWGSVIKDKSPSLAMVRIYMNLLCRRLSDRKNVIWLLGGDIRGDEYAELWKEMALAIRLYNPKQLITFHPRGRTSSAQWFNDETWLDFNMVQSGHKDYAQDSTGYGEDNWRYIADALAMKKRKPILDGEIIYEDIPHGLKDTTAIRWTAADVRRYAYWSVFAGACGVTYGHNSVMQFYEPGDKDISFSPHITWEEALNAEGAKQMYYLKTLMQGRMFDRTNAVDMVIDQGTRYNYVAAVSGKHYALFYTCNGRTFTVNGSLLEKKKVQASWFNPRNGLRVPAVWTVVNGNYCFHPSVSSGNNSDVVLELIFLKK